MGNAAAIHSVAESSRRRLLVRQYNRQPRNVLISHTLMQAFKQRRLANWSEHVQQDSCNEKPPQSLPLHEIYGVLKNEFGVQLTLEELVIMLGYLGCRVVNSSPAAVCDPDSAIEWCFINRLVKFIAPRQVSREINIPMRSRSTLDSHINVTIWQAAKIGNLEFIKGLCTTNSDVYRALDDFGNSPLYYASLCGREAAVDFLMKAYERQNCMISSNELLRCVTNALTYHTRALLQQKMTLSEVLEAKRHENDGNMNAYVGNLEDKIWFGMEVDDNE